MNRIKEIEESIRKTFEQEIITDIEVDYCCGLINEWKKLTNYVSDKTPVLKETIDETKYYFKTKKK